MPESVYDLPEDMKKLLKTIANPKVFGPIATYYSYLQSIVGHSSFKELPEDLQKRLAELEFGTMPLSYAGIQAERIAKEIKKYYQDR